MPWKNSIHLVLSVALLGLGALGCERDISGLDPVPPNTDPLVFDDNFGAGVDFQAFLGSKLDALSIDTAERYQGTASLKFTIPAPGDPDGGYAGGAFTTRLRRDLSGYNALTFWAKASKASVFNELGLGNDNTGNSKYTATRKNVALTTTWTKIIIPVPYPERLSSEGGLFFVAEGPEGAAGHEVWFDEVKFEHVDTITNPRPSMASRIVASFVGNSVTVGGTQTRFNVDGTDQIIEHMPGYFTFSSSNPDVVDIIGDQIRVVGAGSAVITAALDTVAATGTVTLTATAPPDVAAPVPTQPAADVISLFSNTYSNVSVDTWSATWDVADVADIRVGGNDAKVYTNLSYAGIEFTTQTIDAREMNFLHLDVWIPTGNLFRVKLIDFGDNGTYDGPPLDPSYELTFTEQSDPPLAFGSWVPLDIPLTKFTGLTTRAHLAQLILGANVATSTVYVDNIYFHK